ncbi:MAG TPA: cytochrome c biogenesis protein CcdA [Anaerolineales bacterium]|nr:cytochrome c biogenesis protein CcdA [Anaerolineales bacterium]
MKEQSFRPEEDRSGNIPVRLLLFGVVAIAALVLLGWALSSASDRPSSTFEANLITLLPAAFLAGILSFLSPCTLPILPAYFAFTFQARKQSVVMMTVSFFLGLATTLTLLGASATAVSLVLLQNLQQITLVGGLVIIVFGVMSLFGKGFAGLQFQERPVSTVVGSYLYGATFALGWTACIGPILGAILTLLATRGVAVFQGALLAFIYAVGLGFPLILVSTFFSRMGQGSRFWKILRGRGFTLRLGSHQFDLHTTSVLSGLLLIGMGYLIASGQLNLITQAAAGSDLSIWVIDVEERLRAVLGLR